MFPGLSTFGKYNLEIFCMARKQCFLVCESSKEERSGLMDVQCFPPCNPNKHYSHLSFACASQVESVFNLYMKLDVVGLVRQNNFFLFQCATVCFQSSVSLHSIMNDLPFVVPSVHNSIYLVLGPYV